INPIGNGYELSFYNNPETYTVEIVSFNDTLEIEYLISSTSGSSNEVTIDVTNENFNIESVGNISFNTFAQSPISESRNILERITAVTTVHHILNTDEADDFDDNGEGDVYPEDGGDTARKFWGKEVDDLGYFPTKYGGCVHKFEVCTFRIWIKISCTIEGTSC